MEGRRDSHCGMYLYDQRIIASISTASHMLKRVYWAPSSYHVGQAARFNVSVVYSGLPDPDCPSLGYNEVSNITIFLLSVPRVQLS